jgi:hypothetical protein
VYSRQLVRHWGRKRIEVIDSLINEDDHVVVGPFISGTTRGYTLITDHRLLMELSTWSSCLLLLGLAQGQLTVKGNGRPG